MPLLGLPAEEDWPTPLLVMVVLLPIWALLDGTAALEPGVEVDEPGAPEPDPDTAEDDSSPVEAALDVPEAPWLEGALLLLEEINAVPEEDDVRPGAPPSSPLPGPTRPVHPAEIKTNSPVPTCPSRIGAPPGRQGYSAQVRGASKPTWRTQRQSAGTFPSARQLPHIARATACPWTWRSPRSWRLLGWSKAALSWQRKQRHPYPTCRLPTFEQTPLPPRQMPILPDR